MRRILLVFHRANMDNSTQVMGNRYESCFVLPHRTEYALKDIEAYLNRCEVNVVDTLDDAALLQACAKEYAEMRFSECLQPSASSHESENSEIAAIYCTCLVETLIASRRSERVVLILLCLVLRTGPSCRIRASIGTVKQLMTRCREIQGRSDVACSLAKEVLKHIVVSGQTLPVHLDYIGVSSRRDNLEAEITKELCRGANTGRSVSVVPRGKSDVDLIQNSSGETILHVGSHLSGECSESLARVVLELTGVIPSVSNQNPQSADVALWSRKDIKKLITSGRLP